MDTSEFESMLQTFMQWGFIIIVVVILGGIIVKWGLKKVFPSLVSLFYTMIPTYIINAIVVIALQVETLNEYSVLKFPIIAYFISPPLVWDSLFGMGIAEGRIELLVLSTFFILFLAPWLAWRTTLGVSEEKSSGKHLFLKRLFCAVMIVLIMGLGLPNFLSYVLRICIETTLLGLSLLFWIIIAIGIVIIIVFLFKRRKDKQIQDKAECEWVDGEWICDEI